MPDRKKDYPCISCKVHVKKNDKAVKCSLCDLWIHQACEGMSNETFNVLDTQNCDQGGTSLLYLLATIGSRDLLPHLAPDCVRDSIFYITAHAQLLSS